jgi:hypothetical protein
MFGEEMKKILSLFLATLFLLSCSNGEQPSIDYEEEYDIAQSYINELEADLGYWMNEADYYEQEYNNLSEEYDILEDKYNSLTDKYDELTETHVSLMADYLAAKAELSISPPTSHYTPQQPTTHYTPSYSYSSVSCEFPLHLYSNDGKVYLGKCTLDKYDDESIWYELEIAGDYSSKYSDTSIWNKYGDYGGTLLSYDESAFNDRATNPPIIVDNNGAFIGYLTTNDRIENGWTIAELRQFVENNE